MYIVNATDDSFFENSRINDHSVTSKINTIQNLQPDIIDIGGQSTRPGASIISVQEELDRVIPIIEKIKPSFHGPISIDTFRSQVAEEAIKVGANIINDVSGGQFDPKIYDVAAQHSAPYILMHLRGTPENMQHQTEYNNLTVDLKQYFSERIKLLNSKGVKDIILDPGFGFAKTVQQNLQLIQNLQHFKSFGFPVLMGLSRKSTIQKILKTNTENALNGTSILHTLALQNGADILRVHDPLEAQQCIQLWKAYRKA